MTQNLILLVPFCRYSLAFLDVGLVKGNDSLVYGSSFHDGYNTGIGVFGTSNLTIENNVVHHTVGPCIDVEGSDNKILHNLVMLSIAASTYKVTKHSFDLLVSLSDKNFE